ncbi:MAG: CheY-like chemotaxis protein [Parasphingorhabdus sp.]|jgi:CheY-like chemotaxis protein
MIILVAEDNLANQELVVDMLEHEVVVAENGQRAVDIFKTQQIDLVLMDCGMPVKNGFQASLEIRTLEQSTGSAATPIIALTGNVDSGIENQCRSAGMNDYLAKPFVMATLTSKLIQWRPN